jgi:hypothetical protein
MRKHHILLTAAAGLIAIILLGWLFSSQGSRQKDLEEIIIQFSEKYGYDQEKQQQILQLAELIGQQSRSSFLQFQPSLAEAGKKKKNPAKIY